MADRGSAWLQSIDVPHGPNPRAVYPRNPTPADFQIEVIAWALAGKPRFGAHCRPWYGIGQHCVEVSRVAWRLAKADGLSDADAVEAALWGLLHEGDEVYLPDLLSPIKDWPEFAPLRELAALHQAAVCAKYGLDLEPPRQVKRADLILLATEQRDVMGPAPQPWGPLPEPLQAPLIAWPPEVAALEFLNRFNRLALTRRRPFPKPGADHA